jgi:hypothetical protein
MELSRPQRFRNHFERAILEIRREVATFDGETILGYRGNTTGERSRKQVRKFAKEAARGAMRREAIAFRNFVEGN